MVEAQLGFTPYITRITPDFKLSSSHTEYVLQINLLDFGASREYSSAFLDHYIEIIRAAAKRTVTLTAI